MRFSHLNFFCFLFSKWIYKVVTQCSLCHYVRPQIIRKNEKRWKKIVRKIYEEIEEESAHDERMETQPTRNGSHFWNAYVDKLRSTLFYVISVVVRVEKHVSLFAIYILCANTHIYTLSLALSLFLFLSTSVYHRAIVRSFYKPSE